MESETRTNVIPSLLPCPFCGGEAETHEVTFPYHYWDVWCDGECFDHFCEKPTEAEAIEAWNTRAEFDGIPMTEENMAAHGWVRERTCKLTQAMTLGGKTPDVGFGICSECGGRADLYRPYCPNCGAKVVEHGDKQ